MISDGFAMTQFPAAKAGAIFQENKYKGKFHGEIQPTIPIGLRVVKFTPTPSIKCDSDETCSQAVAKK